MLKLTLQLLNSTLSIIFDVQSKMISYAKRQEYVIYKKGKNIKTNSTEITE